MRYKAKPFEVEAELFDGTNFYDILVFTGMRDAGGWDVPNFAPAGTYVNWDDSDIIAEVYDALHSTWVGVKTGQYIIKGSKGEFYPCDPDVFHSKYEPVEKEDAPNG